MFKNSLWAVMLNNSIAIICWAALAVIFNKWWIALFGMLFLSSYEKKLLHRRFCDNCGKTSEYAPTAEEAINKAKAAGWLHVATGNKDYCPSCRSKFEE